MFWHSLALLALLLPAACGDLPRPFEGRLGATAARLAQPPPSRLAVAAPPAALLTDAAAVAYAAAVVEALVAQNLPAVADAPRRGDWQLELTAEARGGVVLPGFIVRDPTGVAKGNAAATPVPLAAWAGGAPATMRQAAANAAPGIAALLSRIEAARRDADPNSLVNRPVRVLLGAVTGAPGDGNQSLARQMRAELMKLGMAVQDTAVAADYSVAGDVTVADLAGNQQRVEIRWKVADAKGAESGQVVQLNQLPRGTLAGFWADVAVVVAQEAAGGVRDVIRNQTGVKQTGVKR